MSYVVTIETADDIRHANLVRGRTGFGLCTRSALAWDTLETMTAEEAAETARIARQVYPGARVWVGTADALDPRVLERRLWSLREAERQRRGLVTLNEIVADWWEVDPGLVMVSVTVRDAVTTWTLHREGPAWWARLWYGEHATHYGAHASVEAAVAWIRRETQMQAVRAGE